MASGLHDADDNNHNNNPANIVSHPPGSEAALRTLDKRLRATRKKLDKIERIEQKIGDGERVNKEQKELILRKDAVVAVIHELQKLAVQIKYAYAVENEEKQKIEVVPEPKEEEIVPVQAEEVEAVVQQGEVEADVQKEVAEDVAQQEDVEAVVEQEEAEEEAEEKVGDGESLESIIALCQCARMFHPALPGADDAREEFLRHHAMQISKNELDAVQFVCALVDGSGNPFGLDSTLRERVDEALLHAQEYLDYSARELTLGITFARIREVVECCLAWERDTPEEEEPSVESINFLVDDFTLNNTAASPTLLPQ